MIGPSQAREEHDALSTAEDILRGLAAAWGKKGKPRHDDVVACIRAATLGHADVHECLHQVADALWRINLRHTEVRNGIAEGGEMVSQPVAWVVALGSDGLIIDGTFLREKQAEEACAWRNEHTTYGARIIPLYEKPQTCPHVVGRTTQYCSLTPFTLTDEEREAIRNVLHHIATKADYLQREDYHLRSLLERTK